MPDNSPEETMRKPIAALLLILAGATASTQGQAQTYPDRPIHIVVPFAAGGAVDATARLFAAKMQESMGVSFVIDDKPGAGGNVGIEYAARSAPDGYTILLNTNGQSISPAIYKTLRWDPFKDFIPVTQLFSTSVLIVGSPQLPAKNLQELIALTKASPGKYNYGASGIGNSLHLTMELLKLDTGMDIQMVPFRGDGQIINALMGNEVQVGSIPMATGKTQVQAGTLKGIAVSSAQRVADLDVPTVAEQGVPGFSSGGYQAFFVPAGTPKPVVDRIYQEAKKALASPELQKAVQGFGVEAVGSTPEEFAAFYKEDVATFKKVVHDAHIPLQD
jgi:tripartite-type tricarboxylate transporter receptor subunit TctC